MSSSQPRILVAVIFWAIINVLFVACEPRKYAECEQIITLANNVTKQTQAIAANSSDRDLENWLEASTIMKQAVTNLEALELKDDQLIEHQGSLANLYRVYFKATDDAVKAREKRDLPALQSAHDEVKNVEEVKNNLVENINNYCLK